MNPKNTVQLTFDCRKLLAKTFEELKKEDLWDVKSQFEKRKNIFPQNAIKQRKVSNEQKTTTGDSVYN